MPQGAAAEQGKQITDPAEYNAYVAALNEQAPARKIQLLDDFLARYSYTVVKEDALELKLVAQQQAGRPFDGTARQILQVNPKNFRALLVLSFVFAQSAVNPQDPQLAQKLSEAEDLAKRGLEQVALLPEPATVSAADFQKSKNVAAATFQQVLGIVALNRKDYPGAQAALRQSGVLNPESAPVFYNLGVAYISERPTKASECFWAFARALGVEGSNALPPAGKQQVDDYLKKVYTQYHGSEEGLDKLKQDAKASPFPPAGFKVQPRSEIKAAESAPIANTSEGMNLRATSLETAIAGVVDIDTDRGRGSGFFVNSACLIITSEHVIRGAKKILVRTATDTPFVAHVLAKDAQRALALLSGNARSSTSLDLQDLREVAVGQEVYAIGGPLGLSGTVTRGIVSAIRTLAGVRFIQLDAAINPGNSGGPLVAQNGKVLGVITFKVKGYEGLNFAVASSEIDSAFGRLLR